jgi:uncharacterized protein YggE
MKTKLIVCITLLCASLSASDLPPVPFMHVTGNSSLEVPIERAVIDFNIQFTKTSYNEALFAVDKKYKSVVRLLEILEIDISTISADSIYSREMYGRGKDDPTDYTVGRYICLELTELGKYSDLVDGLFMDEGLNRFNVSFFANVKDSDKEQLIADALEDAKKKATLKANVLGCEVGKVYAVSESRFDNVQGDLFSDHNRPYHGGYPSFHKPQIIPETKTLQKQLKVIFTIEN